MTVNRTTTVAHLLDVAAVTLDSALVAVTLADTGDVDVVAFLEGSGGDNVANVQFVAVLQTELFQVSHGSNACLAGVAQLGLAQLALGNFFVTELYGCIAFLLNGLLLHDHAGACFDDSYGNDFASLVEDLRHADLLADDGFLHGIFPP